MRHLTSVPLIILKIVLCYNLTGRTVESTSNFLLSYLILISLFQWSMSFMLMLIFLKSIYSVMLTPMYEKADTALHLYDAQSSVFRDSLGQIADLRLMLSIGCFINCNIKFKHREKKELWSSSMTKAPIPSENESQESTQLWLHNDCNLRLQSVRGSNGPCVQRI